MRSSLASRLLHHGVNLVLVFHVKISGRLIGTQALVLEQEAHRLEIGSHLQQKSHAI